jgi:uncharacterized surface protein with fasciclin (FAS1) repeats
MLKSKRLIAAIMVAALAVTAFAPAAGAAVESKGQIKSNKDAVSRIVGFSENNRGRLDTLIAAVTCDYFNGAFVEVLSTADPITIFAPTNYAFRKLGTALGVKGGLTPQNVCTVDSVLGDGTLANVLQYHVFAGDKIWYKEAKAARGGSILMFLGVPAEIGGSGQVVTWAGGEIKVKNIRSKNAIIHVVDQVGIPPAA